MSLTSRDVLLMIRARDYASREIRNVGGAFGALGKAINNVDKNLRSQLNRSMQTQATMLRQNEQQARSYANVIDKKLVASQKKQENAIFQTTAATKRDVQAHKDSIRILDQRNRQLSAQNALIRSYINPRTKALQISEKEAAAAKTLLDSQKPLTAVQRENANLQVRLHKNLEKGNITWQKYIKKRQAEAALNREQVGLIRGQIADRKALGKAQLDLINTVAKREQDMLRESARRYGETSRTHQKMLKETSAAERKAYEEEAQRARQRLQAHQRTTAILMGVGIAATIAGAAMLSFGSRGVKSLRSMADEAISFRHGMALAMTQIQNDTPATIDGLVRLGRTVGTEIPAAMDTMGSTMFFIFSSLQATVPEAQHLLRGFAKEAVAGNTNIESAARSTIAILNGMNLEFKDLQRVQDFQFQTVRRGVITYEQLANNIGKLIPALARSGQEIETGGAMLAFLTRQGLSAEMATTAAARALELIAHPRVIRRMEDLGIAIRDQRGEFLPLIDILTAMNDEIGHMTAPGRAQAMWDIFGGAGYRIQARRFFDTVFTNFDRFTWHVNQQMNNAGAMRRAYEIMFAEPQNQIQLFRNQLEVLRQEIGERIIPIVMRFVEIGQNLIDWFRSLDDATKDAYIKFISISTGAMLVTGAILTLVGMFTVLLGILGQVLPSIKMAAAVLLGTPVVVMSVVAALFLLILHWDKVSEAVRKAIDWLKTAEGTFVAVIAVAAAVSYAIGNFGVAVTGLGVAFLAAKDRVKKFVVALQAAFAKSGPVGWAILAIGALVTAFMVLRTESRKTAEAIKEYVDAQYEVGMAVADSLENFDNYNANMGKARQEVARTKIAHEGLRDSIQAAGLSEREFLNVIGGSIQEQRSYLAMLDADMNRSAGVHTQAAADKRRAQQAVAREVRASIEASKEVEKQLQRELRARGGLGEAIADYMDIVDLNNDSQRVHEARLRETIRAMLIMQAEAGELDTDLLQLAEAYGILNDEGDDLLTNIQQLSQAAEEFGNVMGNLTSISTAWSDALSKVNEGLEEPLESLREHDDALQLWMASMSDGRDTTRDMFTDMTTIIRNNSDLIMDDISSVIGAVLAMGDAGPDAMAVLATADPDEFLEILRAIRLNAALTSEVVRDHIDEMLDGVHSLIDNYGEDVNNSWNDILEAVVLTTDRYGETVTGHIESMMQAVAEYIEQGGELSIDEMQIVMQRVAFTAEKYGNLTSEEISSMMSLMLSYVANGGDIMGENFEAAMSAMWIIAQNGGTITVRELAEALGVGIEQAKEIGKDIGIEFTAATRDHLDPEGAAEHWRIQLGNERFGLNNQGRQVGGGVGRNVTSGARDHLDAASAAEHWNTQLLGQRQRLNSTAFTSGQGIARNLGLGLQAVSLRMPNIRMPSNTAEVRNALRSLGRNRGGFIPGRGPDRDSVLTPTTPGEFVLRRKAADSLSPAFLHALNRHGADVFSGVGPGVPSGGNGSHGGTRGGDGASLGGNTYQYMPNAQVIVQEPEDIEIELAKFENWLRSEQP